jgi:hypothetical protein
MDSKGSVAYSGQTGYYMPFLLVFVAALALEAQYFAASAGYRTPFVASAVGVFLVRFP